ncbi:MAG: Holliday junction resolvase RuvX [Parcubacteria group bacterium]|nr:Holliday junction resolvase RuvX [Parcubacteria group bacterium]
MSRILGIDYGDVRIGLAMSDESQIIAKPYKTLENKGKRFVLKEIKNICEKDGVKEIIIGKPIMLSGEEGIQVEKVNRFIDFLKDNINVKIELEDERLTTVEAEKLLDEKDISKNIDKDQISAYYILQSYLSKK